MPDHVTIEAIRREAIPLHRHEGFEWLPNHVGESQVVLLGEATHGSHDFYRIRAEISKQLILEKDFDAIAVESDWPDALRVSRHIRTAEPCPGQDDVSAVDALGDFQRFPLWMWRNTEVVELIESLRAINAQRISPQARIGFFGLDLYSLRSSMDAVVRYLDQHDPAAARQARSRYSCFDHLAVDPQRYGYAATFGMKKNCEEEVIRQLQDLSSQKWEKLSATTPEAIDELFYARQNARVARDAEAYYRSMFLGRDESWNLRDTHMADTLEELLAHISKQKGRPAKVIVWAHNSHIGDARATEMGDHGQLNLGQLARQRLGKENVFLLGFTTHGGKVTAASEWDSPAELKEVRPSRSNSYEWLFHHAGLERFFLPLRERPALADLLHARRLERAIGVIYLPDTERLSHYFHADIASQFDAIIHVDHTAALRPLDKSPYWKHEEVPDTYPYGI